MQFKNGYLGAFLVVIAVVMTIAGSYVMSLDMEETTAIKYRDSADLTGLFDAEEAPSYMPFNPSANQTGYYTDRTTKYFDGVNATTTTQPSKYVIRMTPITDTSGNNYDLSNIAGDGSLYNNFTYWESNDTYDRIANTKVLSLSDLVTAIGLSNYTKFTITNAGTPDYTDTSSFITFTTSDQITRGTSLDQTNIFLKNPTLTGNLLGGGLAPTTYPASSVDNPIMAISWDSSGTYVDLFYDTAMTKPAGVSSASQVFLVWGGSLDSPFGGSGFGNAVNYEAYQMPTQEYMVIADGVTLEESS